MVIKFWNLHKTQLFLLAILRYDIYFEQLVDNEGKGSCMCKLHVSVIHTKATYKTAFLTIFFINWFLNLIMLHMISYSSSHCLEDTNSPVITELHTFVMWPTISRWLWPGTPVIWSKACISEANGFCHGGLVLSWIHFEEGPTLKLNEMENVCSNSSECSCYLLSMWCVLEDDWPVTDKLD